MSKIKILYVITSLGLGGAEKLLLSYLKNLDKNKFVFYVCCLRDKPDDLTAEMSEYAQVINLKIKNKFNPFVIFYLIKVIRQIQPDIIHTHLFQPRVYTTIAHLFYNSGVLITHKHSIVNPKKHHIFIIIEMLCILTNRKVIAISQSVKHSLSKYELIPEKKFFVLPNCIDYTKFKGIVARKSFSDENEIVIGTVGRLEKEKGINYLLLAMKKILTRFPNARLEIGGDGSALNQLKNLSDRLGISNSVFFFGKLVDVIPIYRRMDIFVLSSILEGFGIVLLEAMSTGVPIIATNVNGIKEIVLNMKSGILVPPKNPEAIAEAVFRLIDNPEMTHQLVEEGLKRVKLFDIREHITKLDNLYTNLLGVESYK